MHRSPVNSPHKGQWCGALMLSLICALDKRLSKQSWGWWFETPSCLLWCLCNGWQSQYNDLSRAIRHQYSGPISLPGNASLHLWDTLMSFHGIAVSRIKTKPPPCATRCYRITDVESSSNFEYKLYCRFLISKTHLGHSQVLLNTTPNSSQTLNTYRWRIWSIYKCFLCVFCSECV